MKGKTSSISLVEFIVTHGDTACKSPGLRRFLKRDFALPYLRTGGYYQRENEAKQKSIFGVSNFQI
jgi:hypothetical protein